MPDLDMSYFSWESTQKNFLDNLDLVFNVGVVQMGDRKSVV